jgi:hypothetical protein
MIKKQCVQWPKLHHLDVNPIKYIWSIVKCKVEKENPKILMNLNFFLAEDFKNTEINIVKNCVMSMKKRCLSLISSKGERIKY